MELADVCSSLPFSSRGSCSYAVVDLICKDHQKQTAILPFSARQDLASSNRYKLLALQGQHRAAVWTVPHMHTQTQ